jgi:hypothetical protein
VSEAEAAAIDGSWCSQPDCGGNLAYKRALAGGALRTYLWCWRCGTHTEVASYPYQPGEPQAGKRG